jgi:flagellar motor switch/type III secretory pathway protein FliN
MMTANIDSVRPWLILGKRRRKTMADLMQNAARQWSENWIATPGASTAVAEICNSAAGPESVGRADAWFGVRDISGAWLALAAVPRQLAGWASGAVAAELVGTIRSQELSLTSEIEGDLMEAFWTALTNQIGSPMGSLIRVDAGALAGARQSLAKESLQLTCSFASKPVMNINWTLSSRIVAILLAESPTGVDGERPTLRRVAVAEAPVTVDCRLATVELPVGDLRSLRLGDVLLTELRIDGRAEIGVRGKVGSLAEGTLGDSDGRRSIRIDLLRKGIQQ